MNALLEEYPTVTRKLLDLVGQRFVSVLIDLDATSFQHLIPRLAPLLLEKAEGDVVRNLTHINSRSTCGSIESPRRRRWELKRAGIIQVERKTIRILQQARLERAARE